MEIEDFRIILESFSFEENPLLIAPGDLNEYPKEIKQRNYIVNANIPLVFHTVIGFILAILFLTFVFICMHLLILQVKLVKQRSDRGKMKYVRKRHIKSKKMLKKKRHKLRKLGVQEATDYNALGDEQAHNERKASLAAKKAAETAQAALLKKRKKKIIKKKQEKDLKLKMKRNLSNNLVSIAKGEPVFSQIVVDESGGKLKFLKLKKKGCRRRKREWVGSNTRDKSNASARSNSRTSLVDNTPSTMTMTDDEGKKEKKK